MGAGHATLLHRPGSSPIHLAAPEVKIVTAFLTVLCVVATPRHVFWIFGGYLLLLLGFTIMAGVPVRWVSSRLLIEVPFVALALLLPFTAGGEQVAVFGLPLSVEGLLAGWNILAKGTLGLATSLLLAATTAPNDLLLGMQRLRTPQLLITISSLMLRYVELIVAEAQRMRIARISRGHNPRFLWQAGATARGIGSLFLRSYERGERVHLAMLARGWTGTMPEPERHGHPERRGWAASVWPRVRVWLLGLSPAGSAAVLLGVALWSA